MCASATSQIKGTIYKSFEKILRGGRDTPKSIFFLLCLSISIYANSNISRGVDALMKVESLVCISFFTIIYIYVYIFNLTPHLKCTIIPSSYTLLGD